ncbi:hypothetical protein BBP40_012104 [Aspergillus hancockii]|nr:hypothetical protein BBP40_012104 [Aspergillus hancockii]
MLMLPHYFPFQVDPGRVDLTDNISEFEDNLDAPGLVSSYSALSMDARSGTLPPGIAPPLAEDNDHNHSGLIVVITSLALFLILASLSARIFAASKRGMVLKDDYILVAAVLPRWQAICAVDIVLEILILAYPARTIYNVQIPLPKKLIVFSILSSRVILIPLSAVHLYFVHKQIHSSNATLIGTYATTVAEIHVGLSVVVLTVSSLKMFVAAYEDEHGLAYTEDSSKSQSNSGGSRPSKLRPWRWSRQTKDPGASSTGCEDEVVSRSAPRAWNDNTGIVKSVHISVTHETCEGLELGG